MVGRRGKCFAAAAVGVWMCAAPLWMTVRIRSEPTGMVGAVAPLLRPRQAATAATATAAATTAAATPPPPLPPLPPLPTSHAHEAGLADQEHECVEVDSAGRRIFASRTGTPHTILKTAVTVIALEPRSTRSKACAADAGNATPCCGQPGSPVVPSRQCGATYPLCADYVTDRRYGRCGRRPGRRPLSNNSDSGWCCQTKWPHGSGSLRPRPADLPCEQQVEVGQLAARKVEVLLEDDAFHRGFCAFVTHVALAGNRSLSLQLVEHAPAPAATNATGNDADGPDLAVPPFVGTSARTGRPRFNLRSTWLPVTAGRYRYYTFAQLAGDLLSHYRSVHARRPEVKPAEDWHLLQLPTGLNCSGASHSPFMPVEFRGADEVATAALAAHADERKLDRHELIAGPIRLSGLVVKLRAGRQLQQNRDVLAATTRMVDTKTVCQRTTDVFVWIEDDVTLCPGALNHVRAAAAWMSSAAEPPVYLRMSMGFIGIMFHCSFVDTVLAHYHEAAARPGVDWSTAFKFDGRVKTYRWNLFEHLGSAETTAGHDTGHLTMRTVLLMRCWDLNIATMVAARFDLSIANLIAPGEKNGGFDDDFDFPRCRHHVASPCSKSHTRVELSPLLNGPLRGVGTLDGGPFGPTSGSWPGKPTKLLASLGLPTASRWFELQPDELPAGFALYLGTNPLESCTDRCNSVGSACSTLGLTFANSFPALAQLLAAQPSGPVACSKLQVSSHDSEWLPAYDVDSGTCIVRAQAPVCDGAVNLAWYKHGMATHRRICVCGRRML